MPLSSHVPFPFLRNLDNGSFLVHSVQTVVVEEEASVDCFPTTQMLINTKEVTLSQHSTSPWEVVHSHKADAAISQLYWLQCVLQMDHTVTLRYP